MPFDILIKGGSIATEPLHRGCAVAAGAARETASTFHRFGGHPGDAGEFEIERIGFGCPPLV